MLNFENVLKTIRSAKDYHTHEKQKGGVTDEYRMKHITMEEEYSMAEKVLLGIHLKDAVQPNASKPDVMRSLPPIDEIEAALNLAQCELRSLYRRVGIKESNVLKDVDTTLGKIWAAMPS